MPPFTSKNWNIGKAPRRTILLGDKSKRVESAQHVIEFPGGAVEVSRCADGTYWAHIIVNKEFCEGDGEGRTSARGEVVCSRIDGPEGVVDVPFAAQMTQIAVQIRPR